MWRDVVTPDPVEEMERKSAETPVNGSLLELKTQFPWYTVPVPEHWMDIGLPEIDSWEMRLLGGSLIVLILFSYGANTLWFVIYRQ